MVTPDQPTPAAARSRARTTVLLVDDQRFVGLALARLLDAESGFDLHCCERGAEAVATAGRVHPDVILQDLVMPDADGLTLVRVFRECEATAATPVIVLSAHDDAATRARALAAGAVDYLVKLPSKDAIIACLARHLDRAAAARPEPAAVVDAAQGDVLDHTVLDDYRDPAAADPNEAVRSLVEIFLADSADLAGRMRAAVAARDADAAARAAHALKGCAMAVGARPLAAFCAQLEAGGVPDLAGVARLQHEIDRVRDACALAAVR
jgi:DNA-binding response OmpR family regulator